MTDISEFIEEFDGSELDSGVWAEPSPDFGTLTVSGGKLASTGIHIAVTTIDSFEFAVNDTLTIHIAEGEYPGYITVSVGDRYYSTYDWFASGEFYPGPDWYVKFLRHVVADSDGIDMYHSTDGEDWTYVGSMLDYVDYTPGPIKLDFEGQWEISSVLGGTESTGSAESEPFPDYYDPYISVEPQTSFGCSTVLEQMREYSKQVKRAVRIVSATEISQVDINGEGLPTGFEEFEDPAPYVSATKEVKAGAEVLSLDRADRSVSASADFKEDDVRILISRHRTPQMLPTFGGMDPAPVKRLSMTFTPEHFRCSVEFHVADEGGAA